MGTEVTVLAAPHEVEHATRAVGILFEVWEQRLSRFRADSELSQLNAAAGGWQDVSPLLHSILTASLQAARTTGGIFDPTILSALLEAGYDRTFEKLQPAPAPAPSKAPRRERPAGAWRKIELEASRVRLPAGVGLDFGGIAKGMAVDAAYEVLARRGLSGFAIDAGGDLRVHGHPAGLPFWTVAVETGGEDLTITIDHGALATSSTRGRRWTKGGREAHHLIDPRTGSPSTSGMVSATVAAAPCAEAEVAAKVALILGAGAGPGFLAARNLDGLLCQAGGDQIRVGNWPAAT